MTSLRRRLEHRRREQQPFIVVNRPTRYGSPEPVRRHRDWWALCIVAALVITAIIVWGRS